MKIRAVTRTVGDSSPWWFKMPKYYSNCLPEPAVTFFWEESAELFL